MDEPRWYKSCRGYIIYHCGFLPLLWRGSFDRCASFSGMFVGISFLSPFFAITNTFSYILLTVICKLFSAEILFSWPSTSLVCAVHSFTCSHIDPIWSVFSRLHLMEQYLKFFVLLNCRVNSTEEQSQCGFFNTLRVCLIFINGLLQYVFQPETIYGLFLSFNGSRVLDFNPVMQSCNCYFCILWHLRLNSFHPCRYPAI